MANNNNVKRDLLIALLNEVTELRDEFFRLYIHSDLSEDEKKKCLARYEICCNISTELGKIIFDLGTEELGNLGDRLKTVNNKMETDLKNIQQAVKDAAQFVTVLQLIGKIIGFPKAVGLIP
jgi:hypothetical protein